jgi:hypothetical protein
MSDDMLAAALAERERIAKLAERCGATYDRGFQPYSFADLIRSGATGPPWCQPYAPDPLSTSQGDGKT